MAQNGNDANANGEVQTQESQSRIPWLDIGGRFAVAAISHPFEYVKVLIQIGHEPLPPRATHTLFGRPALALPGAWQYMKHIKAVDGFFGLYRGLGPKLCTNLVTGYVYSAVMEQLPQLDDKSKKEGEEEEELTEEEHVQRFLKRTVKETLSRCAAVLASHPFHVITIRTMAQFVGREENYRGLFPSIYHVFKEDGIRGYFVGLIPRMVGEVLTLWFAQVATFVINTYIVEEKVLRSYIGTSLMYVASALTYPFTVVCNVMATNNCGLAAGMPPNMPIYLGWTDCWSHLSQIGHLKRGSSILWRYYTGPIMLDAHGRPSYPKKTSFKNPSLSY